MKTFLEEAIDVRIEKLKKIFIDICCIIKHIPAELVLIINYNNLLLKCKQLIY